MRPATVAEYLIGDNLVHRACGKAIELRRSPYYIYADCAQCGTIHSYDRGDTIDPQAIASMFHYDDPATREPDPLVFVEEQIGDKRFTRLVPKSEAHRYDPHTLKV